MQKKLTRGKNTGCTVIKIQRGGGYTVYIIFALMLNELLSELWLLVPLIQFWLFRSAVVRQILPKAERSGCRNIMAQGIRDFRLFCSATRAGRCALPRVCGLFGITEPWEARCLLFFPLEILRNAHLSLI